MRIAIFTIIFVLTLCSFACDNGATDQAPPRKLKPYNPEKAGAVIVESFDLTDNGFVSRPGSVGSPPKIIGNYDLAEYNDCIYIMATDYIYIFEKETMHKQTELSLNNIPNYFGFRYADGKGLAVVNGDTAFSLLCQRGSVENCLVSIDLSTGDTLIINDEKELGFSLNPGRPYSLMGYNKGNESIWLLIDNIEKNNFLFHFFQYANDMQNFTALGSQRGFMPSGYWLFVYGASVYGNESWNTVHTSLDFINQVTMVGIEKRNIDNPEEVLHFIDVEYLGTLTIPQSIIYDKPYIWMLAEKDNQVQMLKLLPNE